MGAVVCMKGAYVFVYKCEELASSPSLSILCERSISRKVEGSIFVLVP